MNIRNKLYGLVIGCAAGDALDAATEGASKQDMEIRYADYDDLTDIRQLSWFQAYPNQVARFWRMPGLYTDDTKQLLALLVEGISYHDTTLAGIVEALIELFPSAKGIGRGYRNFCLSLRKKSKGETLP